MSRLAAIALTFALLGLAPGAIADDDAPVVGKTEIVSGHDLAYWQVAWNRWALRFSARQARRGDDCLPQNVSDPVRFLAIRTREEHVFEVRCTISASQHLMLGQPEILCTDAAPIKGYDTTERGLLRCARDGWREFTDPHPRLVLDGQELSPGPAVRVGIFRFTMPSHDNQFRRPGIRSARAAAVARATMIRPLTRGSRARIQGIRYRGEHNVVVVYKLTVV
jgi:hypothetical protein